MDTREPPVWPPEREKEGLHFLTFNSDEAPDGRELTVAFWCHDARRGWVWYLIGDYDDCSPDELGRRGYRYVTPVVDPRGQTV